MPSIITILVHLQPEKQVGFFSWEMSSTQQLNVFFITVAGSDIISSFIKMQQIVIGELSFDSPTAVPTFKHPVYFFQFFGF